jgi:hypothetical protein
MSRMQYLQQKLLVITIYTDPKARSDLLFIQLEKLPDDKECESYTLDARQTKLQLKKKSIKFCGVPGCTHFHSGQIQVLTFLNSQSMIWPKHSSSL